MTDNCPPTACDELRAENDRLKQVSVQYTALLNWVAEARDKTYEQSELQLDPGMSAVFAAMNLAYENVSIKAEELAYPPDPATTAGGATGYGDHDDPLVGPVPREDREGR